MFLKRVMKNGIRQRAAVLLSAIFITAIAAILATTIAEEERVLIFQAELLKNADAGYLALQGVQDWGLAQIKSFAQQMAQGKKPTWDKVFPIKKLGSVALSGVLIDQQARFNLNALVDPKMQPSFARLLQTVVPDLGENKALVLARAVTAWVSTADNDDVYLRREPPYRAPHRLMVHVSELRAVQGFTAALYERLLPYVTALPDLPTAINVNTVSLPVLLSQNLQMTREQAQQIIQCRQSHGWFWQTSQFDTICLAPLKLSPMPAETTRSHYFLLKSQAMVGFQQVTLTSLLAVIDGPKNTFIARVIWQSLG